MNKSLNFDGFWAVACKAKPTFFCSDKCEIWNGGADMCHISHLSVQHVIFGRLSKRNSSTLPCL